MGQQARITNTAWFCKPKHIPHEHAGFVLAPQRKLYQLLLCTLHSGHIRQSTDTLAITSMRRGLPCAGMFWVLYYVHTAYPVQGYISNSYHS